MSDGLKRAPESLAERFWSLARGMERDDDSSDPLAVVAHVRAVLDALAGGQVGRDLTSNTVSFLALLRQHEVKGDLLYASPEQARGEEMDERSLVFSVGVLMFEKLTGRHPFGAEGNPQRVSRIRRGEMASGVNYFPKVPAELRNILVKAMGPFPEERYGSLAELRAELDEYVDRAKDPERRAARERSARASRPSLPGAGGIDDSERTSIHIRRLPENARPGVGRTSVETKSVPGEVTRRVGPSEPPPPREVAPAPRGERGPTPEPLPSPLPSPMPSPTIEPPRAFEPPLRRPGLPPVAYALLGAAVASLVFLLIGRSPAPARALAEGGTGPGAIAVAPAPIAAAPAPIAASRAPIPAGPASGPAAAAAIAPPTARPSTPSPVASSAPIAARTPASPASPASPSSPGSPSSPASSSPALAAAVSPAAAPVASLDGPFDAEAGGKAALAAVRSCIGANRTVQFGASLLYKKATGRSSKIFYGARQQVQPAEVSCLARSLLGLAAGGAPTVNTVVSYDFHLSPGNDRVRTRIDSPK